MRDRASGKLFLICGPSGIGKSTVAKRLVEAMPEMKFLQKAVTRELRPGERDGPEVVCLTQPEFDAAVLQSRVVAHYPKYGQCYGLLQDASILRSSLWQVKAEICGLDALASSDGVTIGDAYQAPIETRRVWPNTIVVLMVASLTTVVRRILGKHSTDQEKAARLAVVGQEFAEGFPENVPLYDHRVSAEKAIDQVIASIIGIVHRESNRVLNKYLK